MNPLHHDPGLALAVNSEGSRVWFNRLKGRPATVRQTDDGSVIIAGNIRTEGGTAYGWLARMDPDGILVWSRQYGSDSSDEHLNSVRQTADGGFIAVGTTTTSLEDGIQDVWVIRTDSTGELLWYGVWRGGVGQRA